MKYLKQNGYTLAELLIYIFLVGVVSSVLYKIFITNSQVQLHQEEIVNLFQELRGTMGIMTREIRMAGFTGNDGDPGSIGFQLDNNPDYNSDNDSIHFTMDLTNDANTGEPDGDTQDPDEDIIYYLAGTTLIRRNGFTGEENVMAENISSLSFVYYDETNTVMTHPLVLNNIRSVEISIEGQTSRASYLTKEKASRSLTSRVQIRNAGLN